MFMPGLARVYQMMESPIKGYRAQTQIQPLLWQIRLRVLKMNVSSFFSYFFVVLSMFGKLKKLYRLLQVPQPPPNEPNGLLSYFAENPPVDEERTQMPGLREDHHQWRWRGQDCNHLFWYPLTAWLGSHAFILWRRRSVLTTVRPGEREASGDFPLRLQVHGSLPQRGNTTSRNRFSEIRLLWNSWNN